MPPKNTAQDTASIGPPAIAVLLGVLLSQSSVGAAPVQTQQVGLAPGWNLISIQVGPSFGLPAIRSGLSNKLISVWTYDSATREWLTYQATNAAYPHNLAMLTPGRGYWVQMLSSATLILTGETWTGTLQLQPGWNLVGFPGLARETMDLLDFNSIFRTNLARVPQVWAWDTSPASRFTGYDAQALPPLTNLTGVAAGRGYWVRSLDTLTLAAEPQILLSPDTDAPPLATNNCTFGGLTLSCADTNNDVDLNGNGLLDTAATQTAIEFPAGVNQQLITIVNNGLGIIDWLAVENIPWLMVNGTNFARGLVASENETITLAVDRTGMLPGKYNGAFDIYAGAVTKHVLVILHVAPIDGDYRGFAATTRVNGKAVGIGKVDLNLTLFRRSTNITERDFRGVISREQSLLFPRDVYLSGTFYQGIDFFISSNFEVPAGDRNMPPFTRFTHLNADSTLGDRDWDGDGVLDGSNPFPFPLRREITLIGRYENDSLLRGTYYESIQNILPGQPIIIEGDFELTRTSLTPTLTTVENHTANTNVIIGTDAPTTLTSTLEVTRSVAIQAVQVSVNLDFALGSAVTGVLIAPSGSNTVLFTEGFSGTRSYTVPDFNNQDAHGIWRLVLSWTPNGERGYLNGWNLSVRGLQVYAVRGLVVTDTGTNFAPVLGARVTLTGNNFQQERLLVATNAFAFDELTENDFTLTVSAPGYQDLSQNFTLINEDVDLGNVALKRVTNTSPMLVAAPLIGGEPLHVNFTPLIPAGYFTSLGTNIFTIWNFGDTTAVTNRLTNSFSIPPIGHTYMVPGYYSASLSIQGAGVATNLVTPLITVLSQGSPVGSSPVQITAVSFLGSIASHGVSANTNVNVVPGGSGTTTNGLNYATVYQESQRDVAAFDIDRFPFIAMGTNFSPSLEDTDFYIQAGTPWFSAQSLWDTYYDAAQGDGTFKAYPRPDRPLLAKPSRFRVFCTLGGAVFGEAPSRVGPYTLQPARLEP